MLPATINPRRRRPLKPLHLRRLPRLLPRLLRLAMPPKPPTHPRPMLAHLALLRLLPMPPKPVTHRKAQWTPLLVLLLARKTAVA